MNESTNLAPKRRFKEFQSAGDWEECELGQLSDVTKLAGFEFTEYVVYSDEGTIIALRGLNVKNGRIILDDVKYIDQSDFSKLSRSKLLKEDILLTYVGTVGELAIIPEDNKYYLAPNVARIRLNSGINPQFVIQMMGNKTYYNKVILPLIATSSQPALSMENIRKFILKLPRYEEQIRIGEFYKQIDHLITLQKCKLEKIKAIKSAYLSEVFPEEGEEVPKRRFAEFTEAWERRKLGEMAEFTKGTGYSKNDLSDHGTPIILYGMLYTKYQTVIDEVDTFVIAKAGSVYSIGREVIVPASGETAEDISRASAVVKSGILLGGDLNVVYPQKHINPVFLALSISNGKQQKELSKRAQGKSVVHLGKSDLQEVELSYPKIEEQTKIASCFLKLDQLITLQQRRLEKLQNIKKAYLNEMFI